MDYRKFDDIAAKAVGWYVYALRDPRDGVVFYVGKGQKNRWHEHIKEANKKILDSKLKLEQIRAIEASGNKVDAFIIRMGIPTEKAAYDVEAAVIHAYRLIEKSGNKGSVNLTNIAEVHHPERGLVNVQIAQTLFNAPKAPAITVPCGLFRTPKLWYPEISDEELKEATSGWWDERTVKNNMAKAEYAFSVNKGIIRAVYKINPSMWRKQQEGDRGWKPNPKRDRWGFPECQIAGEMTHFLNTSVKHLFKKGDVNPVKFLNCK